MLDVFQKLQLTVCPLCQHGSAERLHDLLDCDRDTCKLVLRGTAGPILSSADKYEEIVTDQTRPNAPARKTRVRKGDNKRMVSRTHSNGLEVDVSSSDLKRRWRGWSGKWGFPG